MRTLKEYQEEAENGNAHAQAIMGSKHYFGDGMPVNHAKAFDMYTLAGKQGSRHAQFKILEMTIERAGDKEELFDKIDITSIFNKILEVEGEL